MNQTEVDSQIEHMCKFIEQEALEKANEIADAANEEFNLEKLQLLESEKTNIRKEYQRKEAQAEVQKKIAYSKYVNESRLKVLAAREGAVQETITAARQQLIKIVKGGSYAELMQQLFVQGLRKLGEGSAIVKCRECDKTLVSNMIKKVREEYATIYGDAAPEVKLDDKNFLNPPPTASQDDPSVTCCGGLVLTSADGRIVLSNTLDDRLRIAFEENLPAIHQLTFIKFSRLTRLFLRRDVCRVSTNGRCFHEVQQVREILSRLVMAVDAGRLSRKTTETARINLYTLLHHPCKPEHLESLELRRYVQRLTHYPNPHVATLAVQLLSKPNWKTS